MRRSRTGPGLADPKASWRRQGSWDWADGSELGRHKESGRMTRRLLSTWGCRRRLNKKGKLTMKNALFSWSNCDKMKKNWWKVEQSRGEWENLWGLFDLLLVIVWILNLSLFPLSQQPSPSHAPPTFCVVRVFLRLWVSLSSSLGAQWGWLNFFFKEKIIKNY